MLISRASFSAVAANQALKAFREWGSSADITSPVDQGSALASRCHIKMTKRNAQLFTFNTGMEFKMEAPDAQFLHSMGIDENSRPSRLRSR